MPERYVAHGTFVRDTESDEIAPLWSDDLAERLAKQLNAGIPRDKAHWWTPPYDKAVEDARADVEIRRQDHVPIADHPWSIECGPCQAGLHAQAADVEVGRRHGDA